MTRIPGIAAPQSRSAGFLLGAVGSFALLCAYVGPWAKVVGVNADGIDDEIALVIGSVSAVALLILRVWWNRGLAAFPLVTGIAGLAVVTYSLIDTNNLVNRPTEHLPVHPEWGAWLAFIGSGGLALAGTAFLAETVRGRIALRRAPGHGRRRARLRVAHERTAFWEKARTMTPYVALEHRGKTFILPTDVDARVFAAVARPEFTVIERACAVLRLHGRLLTHGGIVDVGAHIGTTTISALLEENFGWAVAVEPDPTHIPLLRANLVLNKLDDRVHVVHAAIADTAREKQAFAPGSGKPGEQRWMKGRLVDAASPDAVTVDTVTVDGLAESGLIDVETTALLWFDCSRCEERAIPCATHFLERRVPLVFPACRGRFACDAGLPTLLAERYEHVVDLRSPLLTVPLDEWTPDVRPIGDLVQLPRETRKLTDVLVF